MDQATTGAAMGRPREFDSDAVLSNIVELFWERGFSATSLSDIIECTGLSRSSLYGAFGSKDELLRAALDRYLSDHERMVTEHLVDGVAGLDDIDRFLAQIDQQAASGQQRGCLAVNTATEVRSPEPALRQVTNRHRATLRHGFTTALERAAARGEVDPNRVGDLANNLVITAIGLAVMIRSGAPATEVQSQIESTRRLLRHP